MKATDYINFDRPKCIGIFGTSKKEKFNALLKLYEKTKSNNSILISFYFNKELENYFQANPSLELKDIGYLPSETTYFHKSIPLEEQEKTLNKLMQLILRKTNKEHIYIFLDETILSDKVLNILKMSKLKNVSVIYSSPTISKPFLLLTEEKFYGQTSNPKGIDFIENKTGMDRELIKNMKENEFIYKLYGGDTVVTSF